MMSVTRSSAPPWKAMMPIGPRTSSTSHTPSRARLSRNGDIAVLGTGRSAPQIGHREYTADEHGHDESETHRAYIADPRLCVGLDALEETDDRIACDATLLHAQREPAVVSEIQAGRHQERTSDAIDIGHHAAHGLYQ